MAIDYKGLYSFKVNSKAIAIVNSLHSFKDNNKVIIMVNYYLILILNKITFYLLATNDDDFMVAEMDRVSH